MDFCSIQLVGLVLFTSMTFEGFPCMMSMESDEFLGLHGIQSVCASYLAVLLLDLALLQWHV